MRYNFEECLDKTITIEGVISPIPWQHMIGMFEDYPFSEYFDLDNNEQIVIYSRTQILRRNTRIKATGKIVKLTGRSKRPGKIDDDEYYEYQMLVDNWDYTISKNLDEE
ncbi:MAG: hypothetical protein GOP50_10010 [Candidatus Heimdallarchaeota archaeon]|nr:hypothetical protein [Candidatus Heimdallarchaeota archaeon]